MKYFDTIHASRKELVSPEVNHPIIRPPKRREYFFLYKTAEVVLAFWIVTVLAIISNPWIDYWVKNAIKSKMPAQQVAGEITSAPNEIIISNETPSFYLKNDKVEIKAPIVDGIDETSLSQGIGHHPDSVWPDEVGNIVLAGHNTDLNADNPYSQVFRNLRDVNVGDEVQIFFNGKNYVYQIFSRETIKPDDSSLFAQSDKFLLTFYTCDPPYTDWKRLVFQAKLLKIE